MKITCVCHVVPTGFPETTASVSGDVITVNDVPYDLTAVPNGGYAEPEGDHPFKGRIERIGGELHLTLGWHYHSATAEPIQPAAAPVFSVIDGAMPDPITRKPAPQPEPQEA